jgi:hypothetical protein
MVDLILSYAVFTNWRVINATMISLLQISSQQLLNIYFVLAIELRGLSYLQQVVIVPALRIKILKHRQSTVTLYALQPGFEPM